MRRSLIPGVLLACAAATPLAAQETITAGMSRHEVVALLGDPAAERRSGDATFLFYASRCEPTCAANDLVVMRDGRVADAILVSPGRRYSTRGTATPPDGDAGEHGDPALADAADRADLRRGGLVLADESRGLDPLPPPTVVRFRPAATLDGAAQEIDLAEPGALYPPFGDPLLHEARPLRVRTYVLPGTFEYAEPRRYRDLSPGSGSW
jgi:hypothetical protein